MVSLNYLNLLGVHLEIYSLTSRDIIIIREGQSLTWSLSSYILSLFNSWNSQQFGETLHKHLNSQKAFKSAFCQISGWLMFWCIEFSFFVLIPLQSNNILHRKKNNEKEKCIFGNNFASIQIKCKIWKVDILSFFVFVKLLLWEFAWVIKFFFH